MHRTREWWLPSISECLLIPRSGFQACDSRSILPIFRPFSSILILLSILVEAHHGVLAARAVICPINTRLTHGEVAYILEHSGAKLIIVDHEYSHLVQGAKSRVLISNDTGRTGDPYEEFLSSGRRYSRERGWEGLQWEKDEDAAAALCYT